MHNPNHPPRLSRGQKLIATLLVIAFLMIITGMILPAVGGGAHRSARRTICGNNQRQIILSSFVYANDCNQLWPCRPTDAHGHATTNPATIDGFCTAAASLELLMLSNTDLPRQVFVCPENNICWQYLAAPIPNCITYATGQSMWGANHLAKTPGGPGAVSYAYDWSAPTTTTPTRIMIADRGNLTVAHNNLIIAVAGDAHIVTIPITAEDAHRYPGAPVTVDLNGGPEVASFAYKDDAATGDADDVYDASGDGDHMTLPGQGSATRCWLR